jgi:hypothetical protein
MERSRAKVGAVVVASLGLTLGCAKDAAAGAAGGAPAATAASSDAASPVAAVEAIYQPIAKLPAGAARSQRACADVDKLKTAAKSVSSKAPATSPLDPATWADNVETLSYTIEGLEKTCKAPGMTRKDVGGAVRTVDKDLAAVQRWIDELKEDSKPRTLTPEMKTFSAPLGRAAADKKRKHVCKEMAVLSKSASKLETPPGSVDKAKWTEAYEALSKSLPEATNFCDPKSDDNAVFDGAFSTVHESFNTMVLLLPVAK